jgi:hypothetical protein
VGHPLDGARLKVERAHEHLLDLQGEIASFVGQEPYAVVEEFDAQQRQRVFRQFLYRDPPPRISAVLGDCINNLSEALDYIVNELVIANGEGPGRKTAFPIFTQKAGKNGFDQMSPAMLRGVATEPCGVVEGLQPYHAVGRGYPPEHEPLAFLHRLWVRNKHQALILAGAVVSAQTIVGSHDPPKDRHGIEYRWRVGKDGAEVLRLPVMDEANAEFHPHFAFHVALVEPGPVWSRPIDHGAANLYGMVKARVNEFERFFAVP